MGQAKQALSRKQRLLAEHQYCCFCGGKRPSTTVDHVPPQACFPKGLFPEGFEFPACESCNGGTRKHDQIFGYYSMLTDFDGNNRSPTDINRLKNGIVENYPSALPTKVWLGEVSSSNAVLSVPVLQVESPQEFKDAATTVGRKLACALNYRERQKILTIDHLIRTSYVQIQDSTASTLISYFAQLLPNKAIGARPNIKQYGQRFAYLAGTKEEHDFFVYAAQFGHGLIVWGIVAKSDVVMDEPLGNMPAWSTF